MNHGGTQAQRFGIKYLLQTGYRRFTQLRFCFLYVSVSLWLILLTACSLPSLEKPECSESRDVVKQFYSWYLATNAKERDAHLEVFRKFISPRLAVDSNKSETDPYFLTNDSPTTFKIGKCEAPQPDKADIQVQLYWRTDVNTIQKEVYIEAVRSGDAWLINSVTSQK